MKRVEARRNCRSEIVCMFVTGIKGRDFKLRDKWGSKVHVIVGKPYPPVYSDQQKKKKRKKVHL